MLNSRRLFYSPIFLVLIVVLLSCNTILSGNGTTLSSFRPSVSPQDVSTNGKATPTFGPFKAVSQVNLAAKERILKMVVESNDIVWLLTDKRVLQFDHSLWIDYISKFDGAIIGMDSNHLVWVANEDGKEVSAWDGANWSTFSSESGWEPLPANSILSSERWSIASDSLGMVWISTNEDIRMFDGSRWVIFNLNDLGIPLPEVEDALSETKVSYLKKNNSIWVINCFWIGPGPNGGGGTRYYDGQAWQESDSQVSLGCATTINEDRKGNIWLGLDNKLWRRNPSSGVWQSFPAPKPPETYRSGYFTGMMLDPSGDPWPEMALCGGASCGASSIRYHLTEDGKWHLIGDVFNEESTILFDKTGQGWLFRSNGFSHILEDRLEPVADLPILKVAAAFSGNIWFIGVYNGETLLWTQLK